MNMKICAEFSDCNSNKFKKNSTDNTTITVSKLCRAQMEQM